ncbi:MAG: TetR family transcriptional regulator [Actinomycetia bacterium]|nr:TetR family transcriptional regulator [Actinomycetes bacterium]
MTQEPPPTHVPAAGAVDGRVGLRERKKAWTRASIRQRAFELFASQGYTATTVEQIAAAADISPATFFRYFPTKEDVVLDEDFHLVALAAFEAQPPDAAPVAAYRAAAAATYAAMSPAEQRQLTERAHLALGIPQVRARFIDELARGVDTLAAAIARRAAQASQPTDELTARCTAGAIIGVIIATALPTRDNPPRYAAPSHEAAPRGNPPSDKAPLGAAPSHEADVQSFFAALDTGLRCLQAGLAPVPPPNRP